MRVIAELLLPAAMSDWDAAISVSHLRYCSDFSFSRLTGVSDEVAIRDRPKSALRGASQSVSMHTETRRPQRRRAWFWARQFARGLTNVSVLAFVLGQRANDA